MLFRSLWMQQPSNNQKELRVTLDIYHVQKYEVKSEWSQIYFKNFLQLN